MEVEIGRIRKFVVGCLCKTEFSEGPPALSGVVAVVMRHVSDHRITPNDEGDSDENAGNRENFDVFVHT